MVTEPDDSDCGSVVGSPKHPNRQTVPLVIREGTLAGRVPWRQIPSMSIMIVAQADCLDSSCLLNAG